MHLFDIDEYYATPLLLIKANNSELNKALDDHLSGKWENESEVMIRSNRHSLKNNDGLVMSEHHLTASNMLVLFVTDLTRKKTSVEEVKTEFANENI